MSSLNSARTASFIRQEQEQEMRINDISITSDVEEESRIHFCEGPLFSYKPQTSILGLELYPQVFEEYPRQLVKTLNEFTRPFAKNKIAKLLNYEANMSFLIVQIACRLGKISSQYLKDKQVQTELKLFQFYLTLHAMSNTSQLYPMVWILLGEKQMSYKWPSQRKQAFLNLKTHQSHLINKQKGIQLTKKINIYHHGLINKCIKLKYQLKYVPENLEKIVLKVFDKNAKEPFIQRAKLIQKDIGLDYIRQHFEDKELQELLVSITRDYFKALYAQVFKFDQMNESKKNKSIIELLYMILVAQFHSEDFPFWILRHVQNEKAQIFDEKSNLSKSKGLKNLIIESNIQLRIKLPKFYLLMKRNGFMKIMSILHESDYISIAKQINWNVGLFKKN